MAARVVWNPAGGSNSLPDGTVHRGRGTRQLHDDTGKVQHMRLCLPCKDARGTSSRAGERILNLKRIDLERKKQASLSGEQDSPGQG